MYTEYYPSRYDKDLTSDKDTVPSHMQMKIHHHSIKISDFYCFDIWRERIGQGQKNDEYMFLGQLSRVWCLEFPVNKL